MSNVYYNPEKFGLMQVAEMEWTEPCYSFDTTVAWLDSEGTLYWESDSGCSCPTPFEGLGVSDLSTGSFFDLDKDVQDRLADIDQYYSGGEYAKAQAARFLGVVRSATL